MFSTLLNKVWAPALEVPGIYTLKREGRSMRVRRKEAATGLRNVLAADDEFAYRHRGSKQEVFTKN